jgi:hypothetical protein
MNFAGLILTSYSMSPRLIQIGSYVYLVPEYSPDLAGLSVVRLLVVGNQ